MAQADSRLTRRAFFSTITGALAVLAVPAASATGVALQASAYSSAVIRILQAMRDWIAETPEGFVAAMSTDPEARGFWYLTTRDGMPSDTADKVLLPKSALPAFDRFLNT